MATAASHLKRWPQASPASANRSAAYPAA